MHSIRTADKPPKFEIRKFSTLTSDLRELKNCLKEYKVTAVAMESTGIYWKPIFNILEDGFDVVLANAQHIKNVPGEENGCQGLPVDCPTIQKWTDLRQLYSTTRDSGVARPYPNEKEAC